MPTVTLSVNRPRTRLVVPPRMLVLPMRRGQTVGAPGDRATQRATVIAALELLRAAKKPGSVVKLA